MDLSTVLGLVIGFGSLVVAVLMDGGHLGQMWLLSAFILIVGGTVGATTISYPMAQIAQIPKLIGKAFFNKPLDLNGTIDTLVDLVEKARREGLLALQNETSTIDDEYMVRGIELIVDGTDPQAVRTIMETEIAFIEKRHQSGYGIFDTAGGYAPTIGILGTVMGLVHVLSNLDDSEKLGPMVAVAFMATFYGIFTANLFWLPIASKLKVRSSEEVLLKEIVLEGVLSMQAGESPRIVREKLEVFLPPAMKGGKAAAGSPARAAAES